MSENDHLKAQIDELARFITEEVPGFPRADDEHPNGMGACEAARAAIIEYQQAAQHLWKLLDDISTLSDAHKGNYKAFHDGAYKRVERRAFHFESDGYRLFRVVAQGRVLPDAEPEREPIPRLTFHELGLLSGRALNKAVKRKLGVDDIRVQVKKGDEVLVEMEADMFRHDRFDDLHVLVAVKTGRPSAEQTRMLDYIHRVIRELEGH